VCSQKHSNITYKYLSHFKYEKIKNTYLKKMKNVTHHVSLKIGVNLPLIKFRDKIITYLYNITGFLLYILILK